MDELLLHCKSKIGENFLQNAALHTSWYLAFRSIVIRERELRRNKNRLALIRSAEQKQITIPPNSSITIKGITAKEIDHQETCAMIVETEDSVLPSDFDVTPAVITYNFGKNGLVDVQITNVTTTTFNIPPRAIICELQPVTVDMTYQVSSTDNTEESIQDTLEMQTDGLSEKETKEMEDL